MAKAYPLHAICHPALLSSPLLLLRLIGAVPAGLRWGEGSHDLCPSPMAPLPHGPLSGSTCAPAALAVVCSHAQRGYAVAEGSVSCWWGVGMICGVA